MKKILATLLVATMLLSCLTFVGFASDSTVKIPATFPYADMLQPEAELDGAGYAYFEYIKDRDGISKDSKLGDVDEPILNALFSHWDETEGVVLPSTVTPVDTVVVPVFAEGTGINTIGVQFKYDSELLVPVTSIGDVFEVINVNSAGYFYTSWSTTNDVSGYVGSLFFTVKDGAVGNANGEATTDIEIIVSDDPSVSWANAADGSDATYGNKKMTVNLTGLEKGEEEKKDPTPITQTEVNAMTAVKTGGTIAAGTNVLEGITVDGGDGADVSEAEAYSAVFATINLTDKDKTDVEFGFILRAKDGNGADRFFKAEKEYGGKYGVAFFGTSEVLGWYKAVPAVKLADGTILENAGAAQDL